MIGSYVVTGGARGIGRAIAARLAADGHVVVVDMDLTPWRGPASIHRSRLWPATPATKP